MEELTNDEILFKMESSLKKINEYVSGKYLDPTRSMSVLSLEMGVSKHIIYKMKKTKKVSLASIAKILKSTGQLDNDELIFIFSILVQEYIPEVFSEVIIDEKEDNSSLQFLYPSMKGFFAKIHQLCGQDQLYVSENIGFGRTFVQEAIYNKENQSSERIIALFWFYYRMKSASIPVEMIHIFLHHLCMKMFSISKNFRIRFKD